MADAAPSDGRPRAGDPILVVRQPWIDWLLDGTKTMELRGTACRKPVGTRVYLSRSGTGCVHGSVTFRGYVGPLTRHELEALVHEHRVLDVGSITYACTYAWIFDEASALDAPIPYAVSRGSVVWRFFSPV